MGGDGAVNGPAGSLQVRADVLQAPAPGVAELLRGQVITVVDGVITDMSPAQALEPHVPARLDGVLMPGLVDTHIHAPQWPQLGVGLDLGLERWLFDLTFPLEARCADTGYAVDVWNHMVPTLLGLGTTTAVYHASTHVEATTALAEACVRHGQRAVIGRVAMDHPEGTPEWYRDADAAAAVSASRRSIDEIRGLGSSLVQPIITPRFIPACSDAALVGLGELAADTGVTVQTHAAESDWQHGAVMERTGLRDVHALESFGLLRDHTVLAHGTHVDASDLSRLAATGAGVSHCPLSNSYFANAVFPARRVLDAGVRVGLGTDVAGGPSASLWHNAAHAVTVSRMLSDGVDPNGAVHRGDVRIDAATAMWMATSGGADLVGLPVGLLAIGRRFDALQVVVDDRSGVRSVSPESRAHDDIAAEWLERVMRAPDVRAVWVDGIAVV